MKRLYSIRGAITAENTKDSILERTAIMCRKLFENNNINSSDIVNLHFTLTPDLDEMNPCTALRKSDVGLDTSSIALFCTQEAFIKGGLKQVIRLMATVYLEENTEIKPYYGYGAEKLRPDFVK